MPLGDLLRRGQTCMTVQLALSKPKTDTGMREWPIFWVWIPVAPIPTR